MKNPHSPSSPPPRSTPQSRTLGALCLKEPCMLKMSSQKLSRQYLHLVMSEGRGLYSLRHMDVSKLFYPSTPEALDAEAQAKMKKKNGINKIGSITRLPRPSMYYQPFLRVESCPLSSIGALAIFGKNKNKILLSDDTGHTSIYNTDMKSLMVTPNLKSPKGTDCVAVSNLGAATHALSDDHTDNLFMLDMHPDRSCCFEVLTYDSTGSLCWSALPPPPFFKEREYKVPLVPDFTVVDNSRICVSTTTATYSFDTVTHEWNKVGDWVLPFKAEYIPELGLWLGLLPNSGPYDLCTLDNLSTAAGSPLPTMQHIGEEESELPENWSQLVHNLVNLGSGRFCIVNNFILNFGEVRRPWIPVTVFTGLEVVPGEGEIRMVKHKSKSFRTEFEVVL